MIHVAAQMSSNLGAEGTLNVGPFSVSLIYSNSS